MQYSAKPQRVNAKVKTHNAQVTHSYNAGIQHLTTPNNSNLGQLQMNRKYINGIGHINSVSVLQYHRTTNMHLKNNNLEVNQYQNLRHQQQAFVYKTPQYNHNHSNTNLQQKTSFDNPMQRKSFKEHSVPAGVLQQNSLNVEVSKEEQNQQEPCILNNKHKVTNMKFRKFPSKVSDNEGASEACSIHLINEQEVPQKIKLSDNSRQPNKDINSVTEVQQTMEQILNVNNEMSENNCEEASDKLIKNGREKTPMCLINDLARFNKIAFQYRLTSESGPAHCKRFTVTLILGDEEYTAEGLKIKQAQHLAAKEAIEKTKYKHPKPKTNRRTDDNNAKSNITPTVELNALAMKLGQQTCYIFDTQQLESKSNYKSMTNSLETHNLLPHEAGTDINENVINNYKKIQTIQRKRNFFPKFQNRFMPFQNSQQINTTAAYAYFPPTSSFRITLIVGNEEFTGVGRTLQQAKHDAATNALKVLKEQIVNEELETQNEIVEDNHNKSPISLVFEIGIKRSLSVDFKVLREEGPAHMRTFVTACIVGDIVTEGEGTGKKISKKKAAQKMLEELKKLPLKPATSPVKRSKLKTYTKKNSDQSKVINSPGSKGEIENLSSHKNKKGNLESDATNPITKLLEFYQNQNQKEPEFKLINNFGKENSRKRQFVMEVTSNKIVARGVGNSKKLAKQDAAQNFLLALLESKEQPETAENGKLSKPTVTGETNKEDTESTSHQTASGSQNLPEQNLNKSFVMIAADSKRRIENTEKVDNSINNDEFTKKSSESTTGITEETKKATPVEIVNATKTSAKSHNHHMKDQLMYLANLLGFDVEFSDYPKGNHNEFLTIVMLSTTPPQICHGVGVSANESQEDAAKNALKILSEMGLNNAVKS